MSIARDSLKSLSRRLEWLAVKVRENAFLVFGASAAVTTVVVVFLHWIQAVGLSSDNVVCPGLESSTVTSGTLPIFGYPRPSVIHLAGLCIRPGEPLLRIIARMIQPDSADMYTIWSLAWSEGTSRRPRGLAMMQLPQAARRQAHLTELDTQRRGITSGADGGGAGTPGGWLMMGRSEPRRLLCCRCKLPPAEGVINEGGVNLPPSDDAFKRFTEHDAGVRASRSGGDAARLYPAAVGLLTARGENTMRVRDGWRGRDCHLSSAVPATAPHRQGAQKNSRS
jgi:hypothetical protein